MDSMRTMLIGIDVSHGGPNSVVGFVASITKNMSQYYSGMQLQSKNQEVVLRLKDLIKNGLSAFAANHGGEFPTDIIIYRDGVSDDMREEIIKKEVKQFSDVIAELYNQQDLPKIALAVINKKITQRFFIKDANG